MKRLLFIPLLFLSLILQSQIVLTIEGQTYTNSDASWAGVNITRVAPTLLTFRNNSITSVNTSGYMLQCGDDDTRTTANNLDDARVFGNKLDWNGTPMASAAHGMMAGYNINYDIKYNYVDGPYYGVVHEGGHDDGTTMVNTDGGICYNIFKNCTYGVLTMGFENVYIYNNTFYISSGDTDGIIKVSSSNGTDIPVPAKNVKIKNNIFYAATNVRAIELPTGTDVGFECDYNIYYWTSTSGNLPRFRYHGTTISWATWRALGYDTHSLVVNPDFNNFTDFVPSEAIYNGYNLGASYSYGLDSSAVWTVDDYPDTLQQVANEGGYWQVGAMLIPSLEELSPTAKYVSTTGSNSNPGTFAAPWLTWKYAFATAVAGDTVYFRGGVYNATGSGSYAVVSNSGSAGNPIVFMNYPDEEPILDLSNITPTSYTYGIRAYNNKDYIEFYGLTIRNLSQSSSATYVQAISIELCDNVRMERLKVHHIEGVGIGLYGCAGRNYIKNCDVWNVCDSLHASQPGQNGVGFQWSTIASTYGSGMYNARLYYEGCRTWNFSDNGFAGPGVGYIEIDSCWAWNGGMLFGEGCAFKYGFISSDLVNDTSRYVHHCIAAENGNYGFSPNNLNQAAFNGRYYNNFSYRNGYKHYLADWNTTFGVGFLIFNYAGTSPDNELYANNIAYLNESANIRAQDTYTHDHNSWDQSGFTVSATDFQSLDTAQLRLPRQSDGSLPVITFGILVENSDLINKGVDVGLPFNGDAPDLGWNEFSFPEEPTDPQVNTVNPVVTSPSSAIVGGNTITDGGSAITAKGVYWATHDNPTVADNVVACGSGSADYTTSITGLTSGVTYYVKAYVTNAVGSGYGAVESFAMAEEPPVVIGGPVGVGGKLVRHLGKIIIIP